MFYKNISSMLEITKERNCSISDLIIEYHIKYMEKSEEELYDKMKKNWDVMLEAMEKGLNEDISSVSGLTGGDAKKLNIAHLNNTSLASGPIMQAIAKSLAVAELNASMGRIVATPTAGSCGILPAVLSTVADLKEVSLEKIIKALFTSAGVGMIIANNASISGAEGGCQAECGSASCMAAAAAVELSGGTPSQAAHAGAIALKNVLGLVCDPVAGLVEVPCIKRNAMATANALIATDMALAGIESKIPIDEVITAMNEIGKSMPATLKETACGGLANTQTAKKIQKELLSK